MSMNMPQKPLEGAQRSTLERHHVPDKKGAYGFFGHSVCSTIYIKTRRLDLLEEAEEKIPGEIKNEGRTHYIIENTCRKNVTPFLTHYIDDFK